MDMKKRQLMILTVFVGGLTGSIPVIKAQEWRLMSREEIEAKVHPVLLEQAGEFLHFDTCRLSVGTINEQSQPKTVYFHFQNVSQQTITLNKVTTTCGCTVAGFCKKPLAPNEESIISLTFHPRNRPGTVDAEALVYTNLSDFSPVARLSLCGYVSASDEWNHLPQNMGHLRLARKQVSFSKAGKTTIERIACANSGDHPLKLNALLLPSCLKFHTEPAVLAPGQEGDLVITLDKEKLPSFHTEEKHLSLIIDGVISKPSEKTIEVIIKN